ncbi:MAG: cation transporter [Chromatiales bacterium]|nr:MAG: cation transporter [Chromatiales bacterium]
MTTASISDNNHAYLEKRRVTVVGAVINLVLAAAKVVFGIIGQSQALVADGIHSLSDLASDAMVLVAAKFGSQDADAEHPYGHARFETVATIGLGMLLLTVAAGITLDAIERIRNPALLLVPGYLALAVTTVSILSKEWLYHYTVRVADRVRSDMIRGNAWHHRSDAISSVIVFVGIVGTMAGLNYLDAVGAIGVSLMIGKIGWDLGWAGLRELVDTGVDPETLQQMRHTIEAIPGVRDHHMLRTRRMGQDILVEAHVLVAPDLTVSEGHRISDAVRSGIKAISDDVGDVLVHIDPEDDATERPSSDLPGREELLAALTERWRSLEAAQAIEKVSFHYLAGHVDVDIVLPLGLAHDMEHARKLAAELRDCAEREPRVGQASVYFR